MDEGNRGGGPEIRFRAYGDRRFPAPRRRVRAVCGVVAVAVLGLGLTASVRSNAALFADPAGPRPQDVALTSYTDCAALLGGLRSHAAASVERYGLPGDTGGVVYDRVAPMPARERAASAAPAHSVTNNQESGADEPDLMKSSGDRIVSVSGGELRVIDTATRTVTGSLDLGVYTGSRAAQLLVSGDRALVLIGSDSSGYGTDVVGPGAAASSTYVLVDLRGHPTVVSTFHPKGSYVDARLVGARVRLVVRTAPTIRFPLARTAVRHTPLDSWLPSYEVTAGGVTTSHDVPCTQVRHPAVYSGTSLLTVYTIDPARGFGDLQPVGLAADATTVYATTSSLYIASQSPGARRTQLHRFDIRGSGRPVYLGSGTVPGTLLDSYSISDYRGHLRVVTSDSASSSMYVLDADTLRQTGHVGGLGTGQRVYAVRFAGPVGYVVTFRSVDPLYVLDLHDATQPRAAGEVHITGYSSYLHPTGEGRLLGVGQDVHHNVVAGLQVSLFDVATPSRPARLDRVVLPHTAGEDTVDPHAFLYWPATGTAVVPISSWEGAQSGRVLVLQVTSSDLRRIGTVSQGSAIERSLVVGDQLWTMSADGFAVSDLRTLRRAAWIPFS